MNPPHHPQRAGKYSRRKSIKPGLCLASLFFLLFLFTARSHAYPEADPAGKVIGIHLGSAESRVGATNDRGGAVPSYVTVSDEGLIAGDAARDLNGPNLMKAVFDMKNYFAEESPTRDIPPEGIFSYTIENGAQTLQADINSACYSFTPGEIYAPLLATLRTLAESHIGSNMAGAVVASALPYDESTKSDLEEAGMLSGLPIHRHIRESTGTILALGLDELSYESDRYVLLYDLSQDFDTLTISIIEIDTGVFDTVSTHITTGIAGDINEKPLFGDDPAPPSYSSQMRRMDLTLDEASITAISTALSKANLSSSDITDLIFSPSSREFPRLQKRISGWFDRPRIANTQNLDGGPVWGATMVAGIFTQQDDIVPCFCSTRRPAISIDTIDGFVEVLPECQAVPVFGVEKLRASCHTNKTVLKVYMRDAPVLEVQSDVDFEVSFVEDTVRGVLMGEFELSTECRGGEGGEIEVSALLNRGSALKVQGVNLQTGESVMLTFPTTKFECGNGERYSPRNYTVTSGSDLGDQYRRDLKTFVGLSGDEKPVDAFDYTLF